MPLSMCEIIKSTAGGNPAATGTTCVPHSLFGLVINVRRAVVMCTGKLTCMEKPGGAPSRPRARPSCCAQSCTSTPCVSLAEQHEAVRECVYHTA